MNETFSQTIPDVIRRLLSSVHTAMPGKIESYNPDTKRAEVTPTIKHVTKNNVELDYQTISDVPVLQYGGKSGVIDIEFQKGDPVLLLFCESEIGGWKGSDGKTRVAPESLSHHQITDAIAIPGIMPDRLNFTSRVKIEKSGRVTINDHFTVDP